MNNNHNNGRKPYSGGNGGGSKQSGGGKPQAPALEKITAPYNFVPLSKKVFFPQWSGQVSHDIPFKDGISGELVCELVTDTPVYVRNGGKWDPGDSLKKPEAQSFFYVQPGTNQPKVFMIPGTSLKGMLRNVVEIASFGKMSRVDDHRYGVRDLQNRDIYGNFMTTSAGGGFKPLSNGGWLSLDRENDNWRITPCLFARVDHKLLNNPKLHGCQSAVSKYSNWGETRLNVSFECTAESPHPHSGGKRLIYRKVTELGCGSQKGTLVFTGQPTVNDGRPGRKHMEFIFFKENKDKTFDVPKYIKKDFQFIHSDANENPNDEWAYWKNKLSSGERVPVFYLTNDDSSLHSIGLALMYRLPYSNSVKQAVKHTSADHDSTSPDLAETIFGFVGGNGDALKGRVSISPAVATHAEPFSRIIKTVLGSPKPTFYPNYIRQEEGGKVGIYKTFMNHDCEISGWKRYPARQPGAVNVPEGVGSNVDTGLIPLKEKARFKFSIKLHNLKKAELGAIAWALTWGGDNRLRHSLGMGKSMGYGIASISIASADVDWQGAMKEFEALMGREFGGNWIKSEQMEQLLAMANPQVTPQCGKLEHLELGMNGPNRFSDAKKAKLALLPHIKRIAIPDAERCDLKKAPPPPVSKEEQRPPTQDGMAALFALHGSKKQQR